MRKYFPLLFFFFAFLHGVIFAQGTVKDKSLLWRISSPQMKKPSYLFGTIHLICKQDYVWTPAMKNALQSCDEVCFEMNMDDPSLMIDIAQGMIDNSGKQLKDYFSEGDYNKISRFLADSLHMSISLLQQIKPAALQSLFIADMLDCNEPLSYESTIMEEAKKQNKHIDGLETAQEQLALFDDLPVDSVIKDLITSVDSYAVEKQQYRKLVNLYKKQDLPALYNIIKTSGDLGDTKSALLDERNIKWIEGMVDKMDQGSVFFAVGAGHLWGDSGVIALLRNANYTVEPVK